MGTCNGESLCSVGWEACHGVTMFLPVVGVGCYRAAAGRMIFLLLGTLKILMQVASAPAMVLVRDHLHFTLSLVLVAVVVIQSPCPKKLQQS